MVGYSLTTSQVQQVVTGQGGRMCTFRTDRTKRDTETQLEHKRDTDTRLEHQERHRHRARTQEGHRHIARAPRETQTHGPNTRGTQTHSSNTKRDTDTRLEHQERQHRYRRRTQTQADTGAHCKGDLRPIYACDTSINIPIRNRCPK